MIKRGKIKPHSKSPYVVAQALKGQQKKGKKERTESQNETEKFGCKEEVEEEEVISEEEMMDAEDAFLLHKLSKQQVLGEGENGGGVGLEELEAATMKRLEEKRKGRKTKKALLPTKTSRGIVTKVVEVDDKEDLVESDEHFNEDDEDRPEQKDSNEHCEGLVLDGTGSKSVVSLLAEREVAMEELKLQVGGLASSFVESPEERLHQLEKLVHMVDHLPVQIKCTGFKLVVSTITELLKDVIPAYRISHHQQDSGTLQKKETLRITRYENGLLQCAKTLLVKLEKLVRTPKRVSSPLGLHALRCICEILVSHPQFNYSPNILKLIVPAMDSADAAVRERVKLAVQQVFREDKRGDITLVGARYIKGYIKSKKYRCRPDLVESFLAVRLDYIERALNDQREEKEKERQARKAKKGRRPEMSKREKKRKRQLQKVEREMLEAKGEEARYVRNQNFTQVATILFEVLFRVIKTVEETNTSTKLFPATLKCISAFCHAINVDFFDDLLKVLSNLVKSKSLGLSEELLCVSTAFDILSGPGEFLTYDPGSFTKALYRLLPDLPKIAGKEKDLRVVQIACSSAKKMLVTRKRLVSRDLVQCFCCALMTLALQLRRSEDVLEALQALNAVKCAHPRAFEALLDSEEESVPVKTVVGLGMAFDAKTANAPRELQKLVAHADKEVSRAVKKILSMK